MGCTRAGAHPDRPTLNPRAGFGLHGGTMRTSKSLPNLTAARSAATLAQAAALAFCLLLPALAAPAAAEGWTVERVLDAVRTNDPSVRAARAGGAAGRAQAAQAWAMLSPHVTASSGFTRTDDPAVLFSQKLWQGRFTMADFAIDQLNQPDPRSALQVGLTVDQPIWNGGRELTVPGLAARYNRAATAMERANVANELLAAVEAFTNAVSAREGERAAARGLEAAESMRESAVARFQMGQVPELDTLRATARVAEARVRVIGARRGLAVALEHLSKRVGAPVAPADLVPATEFPPVAERAETARGELAATRESAKAATTESRTATLRLLPSLNSRFAVSQYRPWDGDSYERRWMVAVMAEMPLFDGGQRWNEARAARAKADEARAKAQALERDMATGLASARVDDAVARERLDAARAGLAAAEEGLRLASLRYRSGLLPLTELLGADAEASAARAIETEASSAVTLAHYRLLHAQGDLR
jgi:outer membrane protein